LLPSIKNTEPLYEYDADAVRDIIDRNDLGEMRKVSQYFFTVSGIYKRLIYLFAALPKFYNLIIPHINSDKISENNKFMKDFEQSMFFTDDLNIEITFPLINLSIFKYGVYYGYLRTDHTNPVIQTLPIHYCRNQYKKNNRYVAEFNLDYFDREFINKTDRENALKQFPQEFLKEYKRYKSGKTSGIEKQWVILDPDYAMCFKLPDEIPFFLPIIIDLIELREAKNIELSKDRLELFQLLVQKLPMDKEGQPIFDLPEARELHKNAVKMLQNNEGIDILTTFAETDMLNIKEARQLQKDNLLKSERSVFNEAGVSKMLFASEANIALKHSIIANQSVLTFLLPQYADWLTHAVNLQFKNNSQYFFEVWLPPITIFNEEEMEERFIKQATYGYAKLLPGIMAGIKQSSLLNLMKFENNYLKLNDLMEPLKSSHTQSDKEESGRPPKPDEEKVDDTIDNENEGSQGGE
jgi:hypothetical protein